MRSGLEVLKGRMMDILSPVEVLAGDDWCEKYLSLFDPHKQLSGAVDFRRYPYLREPVRSMCDPNVDITVFCSSTQMLKTTALQMAGAWAIVNNSADILWAMDSKDSVRKFSINRWQNLVKINPVLRDLKPDNPDLYGNLEQYFQTAALIFVGANSSGQLASTPAGFLNLDEVDKYPKNTGREADAVSLALDRLSGSISGKANIASTPTYGDGVIWVEFKNRDQRLYHVPCPYCREYFTMEFSGLKFSQDARRVDGTWDIDKAAESAYYECPHCGGHIHDAHKPAMMRDGEWLATNRTPNATGRSYRINRLYSIMPAGNFSEICRKHLQAGTDPGKRQNFSNSILAEPFEEEADSQKPDDLLAHVEQYPEGVYPKGILMLTVGVDVQRGRAGDPEKPPRLEYEIVGWGKGEETWGVKKGVIPCLSLDGVGGLNDLGPDGPWANLDEVLLRQWETEDGRRLPVVCTFVDSGYLTETVYAFCAPKRARRVYPCKGKTPGRPGDPIVSRPTKSNVKKVLVYLVSRHTGNLYVYSRMKVKDPGPNYMHFPNDPSLGYSGTFFQQLTAERLVVRRQAGRKVEKWIDDGKSSEALACRRYACAAFARMNADLEIMAQRQMEFDLLQKKKKDSASKEAIIENHGDSKSKPKRRKASCRGGFVNNW